MKTTCTFLFLLCLLCGCGKYAEYRSAVQPRSASKSQVTSREDKSTRNNSVPNPVRRDEPAEHEKPANYSVVTNLLESATDDPRLKTPDQLRDIALTRLGVEVIDPSTVPIAGVLSPMQAANLFLDRHCRLTTTVWARLLMIDRSFLERLGDEILDVINATDRSHYYDNRLELLYAFLSTDDNAPDIRIEACTAWAQYTLDARKAEDLLLTAAEVSRRDRGDREHSPFICLVIYYKEKRRYEDALSICTERLGFLEHNKDAPYAPSVRGSLLKDKIECLTRLGRSTEAELLLRQARLRTDIAEQYRSILNSSAYEKEVIAKQAIR